MGDRERRIRDEAYLIWVDAGRPEGDGQGYWLEAEKAVAATRKGETGPARRACDETWRLGAHRGEERWQRRGRRSRRKIQGRDRKVGADERRRRRGHAGPRAEDAAAPAARPRG